MSRSRKKPYVKDKGMSTQEYWSRIRRIWKQHLKANWDDPDLAFRNPKVIVNDYDYSDYKFEIYTYNWTNWKGEVVVFYPKEEVEKYCRK